MKKYLIVPAFLFFIIHIILLCHFWPWSSPWYPLIPFNCNEIPKTILFTIGSISLVIYVVLALLLFFRYEKRIDVNANICHNPSLTWFFFNSFSTRYMNVSFIGLSFAIFWASIIFFYGLLLTIVYIVFILHKSFEDIASFNPSSFIHSQGLIISYIIFIFSLWTFSNTQIIRKKNGIAIDTLDDLTFYMESTIMKKNNNWNRYSNIFYYFFDFSGSIGHLSDEKNYEKYVSFLWSLLSSKKVKFRGIAYNEETLKLKYRKLYNLNDVELNKAILNANDKFYYFLNVYGHRVNIKDKKQLEIKQKIFYKKLSDQDLTPDNDFISKRIKNFNTDINSYLIPNDSFYSDNIEKDNESFVYYTNEIGVTRFIVSNLFVIQFIASKKNGDKKQPAGYITEDVVMIERYKSVFEEFLRNEISNQTT